jgi:hypothetical protein
MNSSASEASNAGPAARSQLLSAYLVKRTAVGGSRTSFSHTPRAVSITLSSSTHRLARPMRSASSPVTVSHSSR